MATQSERREHSLQRIRRAAVELFATQGFQETTLKHIAEKSGLSRGSISYYFESKRDLALELYHVLNQELADQERWLLSPNGSAHEKICRFVHEFFGWVKRSPYAFLYLYGFEIAKVTEDGIPPKVEVAPADLLAQLIVEGQKTGEIRAAPLSALIWIFTVLVEIGRHYAAGWRQREHLDELESEKT